MNFHNELPQVRQGIPCVGVQWNVYQGHAGALGQPVLSVDLKHLAKVLCLCAELLARQVDKAHCRNFISSNLFRKFGKGMEGPSDMLTGLVVIPGTWV